MSSNRISKRTYNDGIVYYFRNNCELNFKQGTIKIPQHVTIFYEFKTKYINIRITKLIKKGYKKYFPDARIVKTFKHHYYTEWNKSVTFDTTNHIFIILNDININGFKNNN